MGYFHKGEPIQAEVPPQRIAGTGVSKKPFRTFVFACEQHMMCSPCAVQCTSLWSASSFQCSRGWRWQTQTGIFSHRMRGEGQICCYWSTLIMTRLVWVSHKRGGKKTRTWFNTCTLSQQLFAKQQSQLGADHVWTVVWCHHAGLPCWDLPAKAQHCKGKAVGCLTRCLIFSIYFQRVFNSACK